MPSISLILGLSSIFIIILWERHTIGAIVFDIYPWLIQILSLQLASITAILFFSTEIILTSSSYVKFI